MSRFSELPSAMVRLWTSAIPEIVDLPEQLVS